MSKYHQVHFTLDQLLLVRDLAEEEAKLAEKDHDYDDAEAAGDLVTVIEHYLEMTGDEDAVHDN